MFCRENLNAGIWSYNFEDIKNGVYRGKDTEVLFFQHIMAMLNVANITWVPFEEQIWSDSSQSKSLINQIRFGQVDIHSAFVTFSPQRFNAVRFIYPFSYEHMSLAVPKEPAEANYLRLSSSSVLTSIFALLILFKFLHVSKNLYIPTSLRNLQSTTLFVLIISIALSVVLKMYKINLTALAITPKSRIPKTILQLAEQLQAGRYRMIDKATSSFIYEDVNKTGSPAEFGTLKRALDRFPPVIVPAKMICKKILENVRNPIAKYVYLNTEVKIESICDKRNQSEIQIIPVPNGSFYTRSFIVSPNCTGLKKRIDKLAVSGNLNLHRYRMLRATLKTPAGKSSVKNKKTLKYQNSQKLPFYREIFLLLIVALGACILIWLLELVSSNVCRVLGVCFYTGTS